MLLQGMEITTTEHPERAQVKWKAVKQYLENISTELPESKMPPGRGGFVLFFLKKSNKLKRKSVKICYKPQKV